MRRVGGLLLAVLIVAGLLGSAADAWGAELPTYNGKLDFPAISGPGEPEAYSWRVNLEPGEQLRQIDDNDVAVYYEDVRMMRIEAEAARDATGAAVPTTLAVTGPDVVTHGASSGWQPGRRRRVVRLPGDRRTAVPSGPIQG